MKLHTFQMSVAGIPLPERFTYPFCYTPHPLCVIAANEVQHYLIQREEWKSELEEGKMFGVLIVQTPSGELGYLAAFSGTLAGGNEHAFFVPPVYDILRPQGFFKIEEEQITAINNRIRELETSPLYNDCLQKLHAVTQTAAETLQEAKRSLQEAKLNRRMRRENEEIDPLVENELIRESQHQKAEYKRLQKKWKENVAVAQHAVNEWVSRIESLKNERKQRSACLQQKIFRHFELLNALGEVKSLGEIFEETVHKTPPAGAGECAAPKLLQYAYKHAWHPIAMAEFWWGKSPKDEIRHHGHYYPACKGKCEPILKHMMQGLQVYENPLEHVEVAENQEPEILYEDEWLAVVNKPAGMLSVPGKGTRPSLFSWAARRYPEADGPLVVHRLDMATSGIMLIAKRKNVHRELQLQFRNRTVRKTYIALLGGSMTSNEGIINLPLRPDFLDRPRQIVDEVNGKPATTLYRVLGRTASQTRVEFQPLTGRTHQLRVHAAHPLGLHNPIIGDELYGEKNERLFLHSQAIEFVHPANGNRLSFSCKAPF